LNITHICTFVTVDFVKFKRWSDEAENDLISVWAKVNEKLKKERQKKGYKRVMRTYADYETIANSLLEMGHEVTAKCCYKKIEKLIFDYRRVCLFITCSSISAFH